MYYRGMKSFSNKCKVGKEAAECVLRDDAVSCSEHPLVTDEGPPTDVAPEGIEVYAHLPWPWPRLGISTTHYLCV